MDKVGIGIIGCGNISPAYLRQCRHFDILDVAAVADQVHERATSRAQEFGVPKALPVAALLSDPSIRIVVNLTVPQAHFEVAWRAVEAGKSVWNEKPLAVTRKEGRRLLDRARRRGVRVGCAPDTFLGASHQTCRKLIDDGEIGEPVAATAFMTNHGHESWHPNPEFYYKKGAGPVFDMGPYYLTDLVQLMGPIARVMASGRTSFATRTITSQPLQGKVIQVEVPTHTTASLEMASGAIVSMIMSYDVWASQLPRIEIYGSKGSLQVADPNGTDGAVRLHRAGTKEWVDVPYTHGYERISRSTGVADMAYALLSGRPHRCSGDLAFHVLDAMHAIHESIRSGRRVSLSTSTPRPEPLPVGLRDGTLDV